MGLIYFGQRKLLYPAPAADLPQDLPANVERIELAAGYGLLVKPDDRADKRPAPLLIYTHGNAEVAFWSLELFTALLTRGFMVLLVEYPGYGGATGNPGYDSIERTVLSAYDEMVARPDIDSEFVVAYGRSIGGGAASLLASERPLAALCLESTFSSLPLLVRERGWPAFLLRDRFDNAAIVRSLNIPIFLYHGTQDMIVPISHSETLAAASRDATFVRADCRHNDCPRPPAALIEFLDAVVVSGDRASPDRPQAGPRRD